MCATDEPVLDPDVPIIDPHHHLWGAPALQYGTAELLQDLRSGHRIMATVSMESHWKQYTEGPEHLRPIGETEFFAALAQECCQAADGPRLMAGIVGWGNLTGDVGKIDEMLEGHIVAGKGHFRGVRGHAFLRMDVQKSQITYAPDWESDVDRLKAGVACMVRRGLSLDLLCIHTQAAQVRRLAEAFPDLIIILNHLCPTVSVGSAPVSERALLAEWRQAILLLEGCPNVYIKLGGLGNPLTTQSLPAFRALMVQQPPATSEQLAACYRPFVSHAIETMGPSRCMFESNFPVDRKTSSYRVLWNAFKRLASSYSRDERRLLFHDTAANAYRLWEMMSRAGEGDARSGSR
jgi:L-fuconolactonase